MELDCELRQELDPGFLCGGLLVTSLLNNDLFLDRRVAQWRDDPMTATLSLVFLFSWGFVEVHMVQPFQKSLKKKTNWIRHQRRLL